MSLVLWSALSAVYVASHRIDVTSLVRMFPFTPNSIVAARSIDEELKSEVHAGGDQHDSSICDSNTSEHLGGWGILVSGRHEDGASDKISSSQKQNSVDDDVFTSPSQGDLNGYIYSAYSGRESKCQDGFNAVLKQRRIDRNVPRLISNGHYSDVPWAIKSYAVPSRCSSTLSISESARLCQSCGNRFTNSVSLYSSQESLSFDEHQRGADIYSTVCSVFWKMALTFHPFVSTAHNQLSDSVEFSSLWPNSRGLAYLLPEICASLQGSIEALCRIAIFADVVKLLNALIDLKIVGKFVIFFTVVLAYRILR